MGARIKLMVRKLGQLTRRLPQPDDAEVNDIIVCTEVVGPNLPIRLSVSGGGGSMSFVSVGWRFGAVIAGDGGVSGLLDGLVTFGGSSGALAQDSSFFYDEVQGFLGIGTVGPGAEIDVRGRILATPVTLSSGGNVISAMIGTVTGNISAFRATGSVSGDMDYLVQNATGNSKFNAFSTGAGDSFVRLGNLSQDWSLGVDQSDSNNFHIVNAGNLGSNRRLTIDTVGNVSVGGGAAFGFPPSASPPSGTVEGRSYYDTTESEVCFYNGANWVLVSDATTVCT